MATAKKSTPPVKAARAPRKAPVKRVALPAGKKASAPAAPVKKRAAPSVAAPQSDKAAKAAKVKKPKLIRDSFTIPKAEYVVLDELKQRAGRLEKSVKKSELLRAGIKALAAMPDAAFLAALAEVPVIKTGRPTSAS